jgi:peptide/nickel transport system permease protein
MTRSAVQSELSAAYVRTAYGKGLSRRRVAQHALRNALIPIAAVTSWETVTALSGYTVIVEYIFAYPGVGQLLVESLRRQDLPLTYATVMVLTVLVVFANLMIDFGFRRLDPRIGYGD